MGGPQTLQGETSGILSQPLDPSMIGESQKKTYTEKREVANELKSKLRSSNFALGSSPDNHYKPKVDEDSYHKELKQIFEAKSL